MYLLKPYFNIKAPKSSSNKPKFISAEEGRRFVESCKLLSGITNAEQAEAGIILMHEYYGEANEHDAVTWHKKYWSNTDASLGVVQGRWYRGATPPGYPSSQSALEGENKIHHAAIGSARVTPTQWVVSNIAWLTGKSMVDGTLPWSDEPEIDKHMWQQAQALLDNEFVMAFARDPICKFGDGVGFVSPRRMAHWARDVVKELIKVPGTPATPKKGAVQRKLKTVVLEKMSSFKALWHASQTKESALEHCRREKIGFERFMITVHMFVIVTARHQRDRTQFVKYDCTCSTYSKERVCEHVLAWALHQGEIKAPVRSDGEPLTVARLAGRPPSTPGPKKYTTIFRSNDGEIGGMI
jgi:hypothetical protein